VPAGPGDEEKQMAVRGSTGKWVLAGAGVLLLGIVLWGLTRGGPATPGVPESPSSSEAAVPAAPPVPAPSGIRAPAQRIAENGRLQVELAALRDGDVSAVGLDMPDEARGVEDRPVKVVDVEGRLFETTAAIADGSGAGLRLEIDPDWLRPGTYMIEVATAEKRPLSLRRYVLEVR